MASDAREAQVTAPSSELLLPPNELLPKTGDRPNKARVTSSFQRLEATHYEFSSHKD